MLQSMTGFGRGEASKEKFTVVVEVKCVNHRFKDIRFKMSSLFNSSEMLLRKKIKEKFGRGSFDVFVNFKKNNIETGIEDINLKKVSSYLKTIAPAIKEAGFDLRVDPAVFLRQDFVLEDSGDDEGLLKELMLEAAEEALDTLFKSRIDEGMKLELVLKEHQAKYRSLFDIILEHESTFQEKMKERLLKKFNDIASDLEIEESRFMQEVIYYLEKMDITEEINRIRVHLEKMDDLLEADGEVGRQVDFLLQELNRETNTIGSKSQVAEISEAVVQMKVQLEKIREQNLNIE